MSAELLRECRDALQNCPTYSDAMLVDLLQRLDAEIARLSASPRAMTTPDAPTPRTDAQRERDHNLVSAGQRIAEWRDLCGNLERELATAESRGYARGLREAAEVCLEYIKKDEKCDNGDFWCRGPLDAASDIEDAIRALLPEGER